MLVERAGIAFSAKRLSKLRRRINPALFELGVARTDPGYLLGDNCNDLLGVYL